MNFSLMPELCMQHNTVTWVGDISRLRPDAWNKIKDILLMANKDVAFRLLDYMEEILGTFISEDAKKDLLSDIEAVRDFWALPQAATTFGSPLSVAYGMGRLGRLVPYGRVVWICGQLRTSLEL